MKHQNRATAQASKLAQADSSPILLDEVQITGTRREIPQVGNSDLAVTESSLARSFVGNPGDLLNRLKRFLKVEPQDSTHSEISARIEAEEFTFTKKLNRTHLKWTLPCSEKERLAHALGWKLRREIAAISNDEISISGHGLSAHFSGLSRRLALQLNEIIAVSPQMTPQSEIACKINTETFTFVKRQNGPHIVWALPVPEKNRLAKALDWSIRPELTELCKSEIPISAGGLSPYFEGYSQLLCRQLRDILQLPKPQREVNTALRCIGDEVFSFAARRFGSHLVWALPISELPRLAAALKWRVKSEIPPICADEIPISLHGIRDSFFGDAGKLIKQLKSILGIDPLESQGPRVSCQIGLEIFEFEKRRINPSILWALPKSETVRLARAMGWTPRSEILALHEDEVIVSSKGLVKGFVGDSQDLARKVRDIIGMDPLRTTSEQVTRQIGAHDFTFLRRQSNAAILWALPVSEVTRLAKAMNWKSRTEIAEVQAREFAVSGPSFHRLFIGNSTLQVRQLKKLLGISATDSDREVISCHAGQESFTFCRRRQGPQIVWATPLVDKVRLAKAMNWEMRSEKEPSTGVATLATFLSAVETHIAAPLKAARELDAEMNFQLRTKSQGTEPANAGSASISLSDVQSPRVDYELLPLRSCEIAVSKRGLSPHFVGQQDELRKQLLALLNADPQKTVLFQRECAIGDEMFSFFKRQNGSRPVWALPLADKPRLAKAMGWAEKIELGYLQETEIAISGPGLSPHFIGDENNFAKRLQGLLITDPEGTAHQQMECTIGGELFTFSRRQTGQRIVWTFPLADKQRLAAAMGWVERTKLDQLHFDEIAFSKSSLASHFVGRAQNLWAQVEKLLKAAPGKIETPQIEITIGEKTFTFLRRQGGRNPVWALARADKSRFARAMNWKVREEKETSTGVADLARFLSAVEKRDEITSKRPGSGTQR